MPIEKSISLAIRARDTSSTPTATFDTCAMGASSRSALASAGRNIISPRSDKETRQWLSLVLGSKALAVPNVDSNCASWATKRGAIRSHNLVGLSPFALRTNSSSSSAYRNLASAWLVAGWDNDSDCPASVTDPVRCSATSTRSKLRSSWLNFIYFSHTEN